MKYWFRKHWETWLIRLAAKILMGRNVVRSEVVSRRDNNDMRYMAERLEGISCRIVDKYRNV